MVLMLFLMAKYCCIIGESFCMSIFILGDLRRHFDRRQNAAGSLIIFKTDQLHPEHDEQLPEQPDCFSIRSGSSPLMLPRRICITKSTVSSNSVLALL